MVVILDLLSLPGYKSKIIVLGIGLHRAGREWQA